MMRDKEQSLGTDESDAGRIALQKHFVRNVSADISTVWRQLWECARVLASLLFSNMRNIE